MVAIEAEHTPDVALQRAQGQVRVGFKLEGGQTRLADLFQQGCGKARLPTTYDGGGPVVVLLNTSGGITGGDRLAYEVHFGAGTRGAATSQAAEKIYKRSSGVGHVRTHLTVGEGAIAAWIPQETIVFDHAGLKRTLDVDLAENATVLVLETIVLGRSAHGEDVRQTHLIDQWRIRRGGRLIYADTLRLDGDTVQLLSGMATGQGAHAVASLVFVRPSAEAEIDALRELPVEEGVQCGFSGFDGMVVARFLSSDARNLRKTVCRIVEHLRQLEMPRVWAL